jgi:hypothetical protein
MGNPWYFHCVLRDAIIIQNIAQELPRLPVELIAVDDIPQPLRLRGEDIVARDKGDKSSKSIEKISVCHVSDDPCRR